jgi:hypothetical protein
VAWLLRLQPPAAGSAAAFESVFSWALEALSNAYETRFVHLKRDVPREGLAGAAGWRALPREALLHTVDFKDTFLDAQHVIDSFPTYEVPARLLVLGLSVQGQGLGVRSHSFIESLSARFLATIAVFGAREHLMGSDCQVSTLSGVIMGMPNRSVGVQG